MVGTLAVALVLAQPPDAPAVPWANKLFLADVADNQTQTPPPVLTHNFGPVPRGTLCVHTFKLTNIYEYPLQVAGTSRESVGLEPYPPQRVLHAFESADFTFTLDTRNLPVGRTAHSLTANVVAGGTGVEHHSPAYFRFEVTVRADVAVTPGELAFGSVPFGQRKTAAVVLEGRQPGWKITDAKTDGPFTVKVEDAGRGKYKLSAELKAGAPAGRLGGVVTLTTTDPTLPVVQVPLTGSVQPAVSAKPEAVAFRAVKVGEKDEYSVLVVGNQRFTVKPIPDPGDGVSVETFGFPAPVQRLTVRFRPTKPGVVRKELRLETDLPGNPTVVIRVEAVGE